MRKHSQRNRALLLATSAMLYGLDASADGDFDSQGRTVDARARVEAKERPLEWRTNNTNENKQTKQEPRSWYFGFAFEYGRDISLDELYRVRSAQRSDVPLQYLEPTHDYLNQSDEATSLFVGGELTDWLDVELAFHGGDSFYQLLSDTEVARDSMTPGNPRETKASQVSEFRERTYSLTLQPRWEFNEFFAIYGRFGVGYSDNKLDSTLSLSAYAPGGESCATDPTTNERTCRETVKHESRILDYIHPKSDGLFPVAGIGIQPLPFIRLEYMLRADVPIGSATTNITSGPYISLFFKSYWASGEFMSRRK